MPTANLPNLIFSDLEIDTCTQDLKTFLQRHQQLECLDCSTLILRERERSDRMEGRPVTFFGTCLGNTPRGPPRISSNLPSIAYRA